MNYTNISAAPCPVIRNRESAFLNTDDNMRHVNVTITGRVQGFFYRASVYEQALFLGLVGFVGNQPDGNVYLEAEGTDEPLDKLIARWQDGPPRTRIDTVTLETREPKHFKHFTIQR